MPIHVLIADDHEVVRHGLKVLLAKEGIKVLGEAANGQQAVRLAQKLHPDVAVLDLSMPIMNGIDAAREILRTSPCTKSLLFTMHSEDRYILEALRAGARGYVMKSHSHQELLRAITQVAQGDMYLSPDISQVVVQAYLSKSYTDTGSLSSRERQVLQLVAEGNTTRQIATQLDVSVRTAEAHRYRIMDKLKIHDTAGLVRYAIRRGVIQP